MYIYIYTYLCSCFFQASFQAKKEDIIKFVVNFLDSILDSRMPLFQMRGRIPNSLGKSSVSLRSIPQDNVMLRWSLKLGSVQSANQVLVMRDLKYFKIFPVFQRVLPGLATVSLQFGHNQGNMFPLHPQIRPLKSYQHQPIIQKNLRTPLCGFCLFGVFACLFAAQDARPDFFTWTWWSTLQVVNGVEGWATGRSFRHWGWWVVVNWTWHGWNPSACQTDVYNYAIGMIRIRILDLNKWNTACWKQGAECWPGNFNTIRSVSFNYLPVSTMS